MYCYLIIVILITSVKSDFSPGTADSIQSSTKGDASPPGKEADSTKSTNNADTSDAGKEADSTKSTNNADTSNAGKEADSTKKEADSTKSTNNADTSNAGKEADSTKKEADSTKSTNNADTSDAGKEVDSTDSTNTNTASLDGKSQSDSTYSPNNYYNNRQISHAGPTLYVGTWGEIVHNTNQSTVVECTKSPLSNYNNTDYETDVAVYTNPDKLFPNKTIFHSYFSFTRKEVWNCTNESENITFVRIVNEMVGKKEIFELKYVDGITVSTKTFLDTARTAKIREIKYYDRLNSRAVTYHGKVNLMSNALNNAPTYNLKSVILTKQRTDKENGYFTEVLSHWGKSELCFPSFNKGPSLDKIGNSGAIKVIHDVSSPPPSTFTSAHHNFPNDGITPVTCKSLQGSNPFPAEFRPKLALNITKWKTSLLVPLSHKEVLEHFTIINEQVWLCNTDENKKFYRIRSEAISAKEVGQITYSDGIIELHVINLDSISNITKQGIKFTEVKYKSFEEKRAIIYEGSLLLKEPEAGLPISRNGERIRDIQYILEENRIFKSFISGRGINIRIGTHWKSIVPQSDQNFICKTEMNGEPIKFLDTYLTKMSVLVMENGIYNAEHIKRDEMASYFNHTHEEVWSCSNGVEGEIKLEPGDEFTREHGSPKFGSSGDAIARSDEDIYWIISSLIESLEEKEPTQDHSLEKQIKSDGITLEVSFRDDSKPLEKENKTIECLPLDGIVFQTKIRIKKENEITVLREHNTGDYMKLISRQAWKCSDHQNYVNHEFKRIVSDWQVSLDKLKNIQYSDSVDVWYEMDPSGNVTMRLRETFYFQEKKTGRRKIDRIPVKYEGRVILNRAKSEKISGTVLMETMKKFQFTGPVSVPKTYYNLERDRRYYMAGTKYKTLEIGEKWKVVYGDARTNVVCKKKPDEMK
ncbi:hypothetical protein LSTR_LSTR009269 [Laodelphax striatellus]|uniref:Vitellogenin domain-containing protein n=1 Tax=Laodelphax striatellus TaxID=195883 RepID=A0A482X4S8_LAOST|nr:hypothetical protein LSTR_LSTR009269 [Laodelphax striatellus]